MKKFFCTLITLILVIPNFVFAVEKEISTMVKFHEDSEYEYYFYGQKSSEVKIMAGGYPETTVEQALKDGEDINNIKTLISKPIYSRKKGSDDLIVSSNVIKYSISGEEASSVDYYLYLEELDNKDTYCDKEKTICFDPTNKTITLNNFEGENLYINDVDTNADDKVDELKIVVNGSNIVYSSAGDIAININNNPVTLGKDTTKEQNITSSLMIDSGSIGIYTGASLTINDLMVNITVTLNKDTSDAYGLLGSKAKLNLNNALFSINLELKQGVSDSKNTYGVGLGLINSSVDIKGSLVSISSAVNGVLIENEAKETFNLDKDSFLSIITQQDSDSNLEDLAFSLKNVNLNNKGLLTIEDDKNSSYSVSLENVDFNSDYAVAIYSKAVEAALYAKSSKLRFNGEGFILSNNREEKNNEVNSMLLDDTELEINKELKMTPSKFSTDGYNCIALEDVTCKTGTIYTDNKIRALIAADKLIDEEKDVTVYVPAKVDKSIELNVQDENSYDEDWLIKFNDNLDKLTMLKIYKINLESILDENIIFDDGNYKIYVPIPENIADYDGITIRTIDYDKNSLSKEIKYTKSEDEKYYIFEVTKTEIEKGLEITIIGKDKETLPTYYCKIVDGKYYSKDGSVVDKITYESVCGISDNPKTGIALPILFLVTLGAMGLFLVKNKKKDFFKRI